jgi:tetratricopeptide (TPR) repeat protein
MAEIRKEIEVGRHGIASQKLTSLLAGNFASDEVAYLLGFCEKSRGRTQAASEAWARVPPGSRFARRAIQGRLGMELERGRLADTERLFKEALDDPRADIPGLLELVLPVYCIEGRVEEAASLIEVLWDRLAVNGGGASAAAITMVRVHVGLSGKSTDVETIRTFLDRAARLAPEDDRVWLGKANLALHLGSFDEAVRWLDRCLSRRPDDSAVWRSRLNWAVATGRVVEAREAFSHLTAEQVTPAEFRGLADLLLVRSEPIQSQCRVMERVIAADPADSVHFDRLAALEEKAGHAARATELRVEKTRIDRLLARFRKLHERNQPIRDSAEMAGLAEQLGRWFEARVFLHLAIATDLRRDDLRTELDRVSRRARAADVVRRDLAVELVDLLADDHKS